MLEIPILPVLKALTKEDIWIRGADPDSERWMVCRCPFHGDRQASASISLTGFKCHACGVQGDAISLIMEREGETYAGAVARAADILGVGEEELPGNANAGTRRRAVLGDDAGPVVGQRRLFSARRRRRPLAGT